MPIFYVSFVNVAAWLLALAFTGAGKDGVSCSGRGHSRWLLAGVDRSFTRRRVLMPRSGSVQGARPFRR
jgi:hypothetical protein